MGPIDSWERMADVIRECGVLPFFKGGVPGWSVQEMTAPGRWFSDDWDELKERAASAGGGAASRTDVGLGPWDWKVDVVREGDIAYGKFLGGKAAFATVEWYAHLMNWRRSLAKYRVAEGGRYKAATNSDKLMKYLSPVALEAVRGAGAMGTKELRLVCSGAVSPALLRAMGAKYKPLLTPTVKKNIVESVMTFLQMGTWTVVGDIQRVYDGPQLTYKGWQISSHTTPEALFGGGVDETVEQPSWARRFAGFDSGFDSDSDGCSSLAGSPVGSADSTDPLVVECTPLESRELLILHVMEMFPYAERKILEKMI